MSNPHPTRHRVDGHPGIYQVGDRYQARYRDAHSGKIVSRTFDTLAEAQAHKDGQVGFSYGVNVLVNGQFMDSWPVGEPDPEVAAKWPEMQQRIDGMREYEVDPTTDESKAELRDYALQLCLDEAVEHAIHVATSDMETTSQVASGEKRTVSITVKVTRHRADELDPGVQGYMDSLRP